MGCLNIVEHVKLAPFTTIGLGGSARYFLEANTDETLRQGLVWAKEKNCPVCVLGGGSNVVFSDHGWPGLVVHLNLKGMHVEQDEDGVRVVVQAGEDWDSFVNHCAMNGWAGVECLSGIPGKVGATPIQNVGAYGQEVADTIEWVEALHLETLNVERFTNQECGFGYRSSRFKTDRKNPYLVLAVCFQLNPGGIATISYPDLKRRIEDPLNLEQVRATVIAVRSEKSMVVNPQDPNSKSCGSFFTNPILSEQSFQTLCERVEQVPPNYPAGTGLVKVPAAWLIEQSGYHKGYVFKGVGLSEKHTLALINRGHGSSDQLLEFATLIRKTVFKTYGVSLIPEPVIWSAQGKRMGWGPVEHAS